MSKVVFDCTGNDLGEAQWEEMMRQIDAQLKAAGLPSLYSDDWEDEEGGCAFEGTEEEVGKVRAILSHFPLKVF